MPHGQMYKWRNVQMYRSTDIQIRQMDRWTDALMDGNNKMTDGQTDC